MSGRFTGNLAVRFLGLLMAVAPELGAEVMLEVVARAHRIALSDLGVPNVGCADSQILSMEVCP